MLRRILSVTLLASFTGTALAAEVNWNVNNAAVAAGTACKSMGDDADIKFQAVSDWYRCNI
jgi:hypothetical protein